MTDNVRLFPVERTKNPYREKRQVEGEVVNFPARTAEVPVTSTNFQLTYNPLPMPYHLETPGKIIKRPDSRLGVLSI